MASFEDIKDAFFFVSSEPYGMHRALLCLDDGEIYYHSEWGDINELDEDIFDCDKFLEIPHKNELDLGADLTLRFTRTHMSDEVSQIEGIFSSRGAYRLFKELLGNKGMLQSWYNFENRQEDDALRQWCRENGIDLEEGG